MTLATALPAFNACLNGLSALALVAGWRAIRAGDREAHRRRMLLAVGFSCLFLVGYAARVLLTGVHRFPGSGALRASYLALLASHTLLAAACLPLVIIALALALRGRFELHKRVTRITLPVWLYVSVTGVLVYLMLYQVAPRVQ